VRQILAETGLKPSRLQLELTESAVMATSGAPLQALRALADMGVRVAIDDFGTGYSNLAYLPSLPIDALKLPQPLIEGLRQPTQPPDVDERIVDALVRLAHAIDLTVTAEGVETRAQVDRLTALGCDSVQGWYIAATLRGRGAHPGARRPASLVPPLPLVRPVPRARLAPPGWLPRRRAPRKHIAADVLLRRPADQTIRNPWRFLWRPAPEVPAHCLPALSGRPP